MTYGAIAKEIEDRQAESDLVIEWTRWRIRRGLAPTYRQRQQFSRWNAMLLARDDMAGFVKTPPG